MIRLLIITHDLSIGGLQQVVLNLCRYLNKQKISISVLCLNALGEFAPEIEKIGIKVMLLPQKKDGPDYLSFLKVAKIVREEKIDVIHTHNTQALVDGAVAKVLSTAKRVIHTDHARSFPDKKRYMFAEWLLSHFVYKMVGVSKHTCENLRKYEKISRKKISMVPNGIDINRFDGKVDKAAKRLQIGIKKAGPIIGLCVRLTEQKGIIFLLKAMPAIIKRFPEIILIIAGDGPLRTKLEQETKDLGISENVSFIGPRLDINEIIGMLDLYILPSVWEGLPMVILEAMSVGCPVVATDVGGVNTAIKDRSTGLIVKSKSPEQLSGAIIEILDNHELRQKCIRNGKAEIMKKFTAEIMAQSYEKLYLY